MGVSAPGIVQSLSAELGLATGMSLPQHCRERYPRRVTPGLWVQAELVAMATDPAEIVGGAIALNLLLGLDLCTGGLVPRLEDVDSLVLAAGILGATVMPHAIYLHSALVAGTIEARTVRQKLAALRVQRVDVTAAMTLAGLVNGGGTTAVAIVVTGLILVLNAVLLFLLLS